MLKKGKLSLIKLNGIRKVTILVLAMALFLTANFKIYANTNMVEQDRVIFVVDVSDSMRSNYTKLLINETIGMFVNGAHSQRTEVGIVAFNDTIVSSYPISPIATHEQRNNIKSYLADVTNSGRSTDIGQALLYAMNMFSEYQYLATANPHARLSIVLISDGDTDLRFTRTGRTMVDSLEDEQATFLLSSQFNVPIFTLGLTPEQDLNSDYLYRIAGITGGSSHKIATSRDVPSAFTSLFADVVGTEIKTTHILTGTGDEQNITVDLSNRTTEEITIIKWLGTRHESIKITDSTTRYVNLNFTANHGSEVRIHVVNVDGVSLNISQIENEEVRLLRGSSIREFDLNQYFVHIYDGTLSFRLADLAPDVDGTIQQPILNAEIREGILFLMPIHTGVQELFINVNDGQGGELLGTISFNVLPFWLYYSDAVIIIGVIFTILLLLYILYIMKLKKRPTHIVTESPPPPNHKFYNAKFEGYFLNTLSGKEIPILNWSASYINNKQIISLGEMLDMLDVEEKLLEAHKIFFKAGNNETVIFYHNTHCVVDMGNKNIESGKKEILRYDDKIYITFEDHVSEIEIRYKRVGKLAR